jgi:DNA-damage-inducible protein D
MADEERRPTPHLSPFDVIQHVDEQLGEYWSARELYKILGYTEWRNFHNVVIKRALKACEENGRAVSEHFVQSYKMSKTGQGGKRSTEDVLLSRYAAYKIRNASIDVLNFPSRISDWPLQPNNPA